ncbi:placenta-expressed transcript 1 protein [Sigmodon hispidus]
MAMLRFLLPQLGLFLCLALCFSPALSVNSKDTCKLLDTASTSYNLGISTKAEASGGNTKYTVSIPVNDSISAVILKAVNQNNSSVGSWDGVHQKCNDTSVLYDPTSSNSSVFQTVWTVPKSENVTNVVLQVFLVIGNQTATMSSVKLDEKVAPAFLTPTTKIPGTSQIIIMTTAASDKIPNMASDKTPAMASDKTPTMPSDKTPAMASDKTSTMPSDKTPAIASAKTPAMASDKTPALPSANTTAMPSANTTAMPSAKTTAMPSAKTTAMTTAKTTARNLAIKTLGSPLIGALHILLVFLISKLLF